MMTTFLKYQIRNINGNREFRRQNFNPLEL